MRAAGLFTLSALLLGACGGGEADDAPTLEELALQKCPRVHIDRMAGDWLLATGDVKSRMQLHETDAGYTLYYVSGFSKFELACTKRESDLQCTEVPRLQRAAQIEAGHMDAKRFYLRPELRSCSVKVDEGTVGADGSEIVNPPTRAREFLEMPADAGTFTYRAWDDNLFLGAAARSETTAKAQVAETGGPKADIEGSHAIPVGMWSDAAADGSSGCTFDFDVFFDGQPVDGGTHLAAGEVSGGRRHWFYEWDANWSFNHSFEMYRYKTCGGGERELIGVAGIEAVLL